jgi:hypothetical protein
MTDTAEIFSRIESAAQDGAFGQNRRPTPSDAMLNAGNYNIGRVQAFGLNLAIEQPRNTYRTGIGKDGKRWTTRLAAHYGSISGTKGADGDAVDCFIGFYPQSEYAWVINQYINGQWDEHKVMLAFPDAVSAQRAYLDSYEKGWNGLHSIVKVSLTQLKWWLKNGNLTKPLRPEYLPYEGLETMTQRVIWDSAQNPSNMTLDKVLYEIRRADAGENLVLDAVCMADILEGADEILVFDALVSTYAGLERKMLALQNVMTRAGDTVKPMALQISEPFKQSGVAQVAVVFELSDGQTLSIFFHNPDVTPQKMAPGDSLVSWKWLLNKKDVTIVVAPERGLDLNVREVATRIMKLAEKNSAAFARANAKRAENVAAIESLKTEITALETELADAQHELEVAKQEYEDRLANPPEQPESTTDLQPEQENSAGEVAQVSIVEDQTQFILQALLDIGWQNVSVDGLTPAKNIGGGTKTVTNPDGTRRVLAKIESGEMQAAFAGKVLASVPLDAALSPSENAKNLDDAVNAIDPNFVQSAGAEAVESDDNDRIVTEPIAEGVLPPQATQHPPVPSTIEPQGPASNELDLSEDDLYSREDDLSASGNALIKFKQEHQFQTAIDAEEGEYNIDNDPLADFADTAFLVDRAVSEYGGSVVWGNFDASAYTGSVFDSAAPDGVFNAFHPGQKVICDKDDESYTVAMQRGAQVFVEEDIDGWVHPNSLRLADGEQPETMTLDSAALDSVVSPGSLVGQVADKSGAIVARVRIEENGVLTVYNGDAGLERVSDPTAAVARINAAIDTVFGGVENKIKVDLPHQQGNTVEQEKERLRQALIDAYHQERDATKALIESVDDSSVVDKKTAEQAVGDVRQKNQAIRFVEDALIEIENAGFNSDDSYFAIASETPEALELTQLKDQIDGIINGIFQKGDEAQDAKSAPTATESPELTQARAKLQKLMDLQQRMKDANKVIKSKKYDESQKIAQLAEQGFSEAQAIELMKPDFAGRIGFADYQLTNNNATIRNTQKRIAELEARETAQQRAASGNSQTSYEFEGGNIELNYGDDRLQVFFDRKPDPETISKLKSNGFKWSPTNVAWQRQLTDNAISTANYLFGTSIPTAASMVNQSESTTQDEPVPVPENSEQSVAPEVAPEGPEVQAEAVKSSFIAELSELQSETDIEAFDRKLDDIAGRIEAAGLMEDLDAELNAAADKLTELLNEAEKASNNLTESSREDTISSQSSNSEGAKMETGIFSKLPGNTSLKEEFSEPELQSVVEKYNSLRKNDRLDAIDFISKIWKEKGFNAEQKRDLQELLESEWGAFSAEESKNEAAKTESLMAEYSGKIKNALELLAERKAKKIAESYDGSRDAYFEKLIPNLLKHVKGVKYENGMVSGSPDQVEKFIKLINAEGS